MNLALELIAGLILAGVGVTLVIEPLLRPPELADADAADDPTPEWDADPAEPETPRARAVAALREIEFDRETGKLDDTDYRALKARYTNLALEAMRREEETAGAERSAAITPHPDLGDLDALAEKRIARARAGAVRQSSCPECGLRPEADALFCSSCGRRLTTEPHVALR